MIDFNRKPNVSEKLNGRIDKALEIEQSFQSARNYLGGSRIGVECERALQYEFTKTSVDLDKDFSGRIIRVFARGHWVEEYMVEILKKSGFGLVSVDENGNQFEFEAHEGYVKGHCDGVFVSGPDEFGPYPRLWENKGLMQKYFLPIVKHGLEIKSPVYYGQCQYYMKKFNLTENPALFSVVNMNTMEIYWEELPFNSGFFDMLDAKAARIIAACWAGELLPRMSQKADFFKCKQCNWHDRCFSKR
ncbi:MAG: hypothetical protein GY710_14025 [Desulfobacteraceae bacterium]|nr:hypothetical protein [Desulfobacteraceae bacterium]